MVYGIYQSAAGLQVNEYRQAVITNNLANVDTVGFKHDLSVVRERRVASAEQATHPAWTDPTLDRMTGGSLVAPTFTAFEQGMIKETGGKLDVALADPGFFVVDDGGEARYTRDGRFTLNAGGELVTVVGGKPVLSDTGSPIQVPKGSEGQVRIEASGEVKVAAQSLGRLGIVNFDDPTGLTKSGGNLFRAVATEPAATRAQLRVGAVEASSVDATQEMVSMLQVTRAYEMNATLVGLADSTLGRAVNDIARLR